MNSQYTPVKSELEQGTCATNQTKSETDPSSGVQQSPFDPKVSCPIVCGQYMRATGFFYKTDGETYLVTARHNLLPTDAQVPNPHTGGYLWNVRTEDYLPNIDIYLSSSGEWKRKRIDVREVPNEHILSDPCADIFAVRIRFDPAESGYTVFSRKDVTLATEEQESFVVYGFSTDALPSKEDKYSVGQYKRRLDRPCEFNFENISTNAEQLAKSIEKVHGMGLDRNAHLISAYNGLSGAPVLGQGLVGIHLGTDSGEIFSQLYSESDNVLRTHYASMHMLDRVLSG